MRAALTKYRKMRDFSRTAEPRGGAGAARAPKQKRAPELTFVVQRHDARRLHYDFRLELDGVLLSWAVPKGPSLDPHDKRLAVETEPHPLEYAEFEGTIAKGEYGAGTVEIWDHGSWKPEGDPRKDYERGRLSFELFGEKLHGAFHLVRTNGMGGSRKEADAKKNWLLMKANDEFAREGDGAVDAVPAASKTRAAKPSRARSPKNTPKRAKAAALEPAMLEPELATLVSEAPEGDEWVHELKFDGYRLVAVLEQGNVRLLTRHGNDWTERMPALARALGRLMRDAVLDGEVVVLDEHGVSNFQRLQNSLSAGSSAELVYYAFDLLFLDGEDRRSLPLVERKRALAELWKSVPASARAVLRTSDHVVGQGAAFFRTACDLGAEGIVSKRGGAPYRAGRGRDWLKVKCLKRQEFVIVGFTEPGGSRSHFGALLLAVRGERGFVYAGRVGTGFTEASLGELRRALEPLGTKRELELENAPRGAHARGVHWVEPKLVAEVAFTGFTEDGLLRHPTFQGLRDDKRPDEVRAEREEDAPAPARKSTATTRQSATPARQSATTARQSAAAPALRPAAAPEYPLTRADKVLYPEQGITKRELLDYYALVAERMLPHVAGRPLTLVRCPNGYAKPCFFQKHPGKGTPDEVRSVPLAEKNGTEPYSVVDDAAGLYGLVQLGALEIHTWGSHAADPEHPDLVVFDLDPDPSVEFGRVCDSARELRALFASARLESFVKTTGGKGLHVCLPIAPELSWQEVSDFSRRIAEAMVRQAPDRYVATASKAKRRGKIFIDFLRNTRGATFVAPYSTRARTGAPIAVPLAWEELDAELEPTRFTLRTVRPRLELPDPFARMPALRQSLRSLLSRSL
jgi:bifunctional non-homologous end joining protein LigD